MKVELSVEDIEMLLAVARERSKRPAMSTSIDAGAAAMAHANRWQLLEDKLDLALRRGEM